MLLWVVGIIGAAGMGVAGFLFWVWRLVQGLRAEWEEELKARDLRLEALLARLNAMQAEHNEYRVHVAEKFATKDGVTQAITRMEAAVEELTRQVHDAVERLTTRLDRVLEEG